MSTVDSILIAGLIFYIAWVLASTAQEQRQQERERIREERELERERKRAEAYRVAQEKRRAEWEAAYRELPVSVLEILAMSSEHRPGWLLSLTPDELRGYLPGGEYENFAREPRGRPYPYFDYC